MSDHFSVSGPWPVPVEQELKHRGYVSMASLLRTVWDPLPDSALGSDVYRDGPEEDE